MLIRTSGDLDALWISGSPLKFLFNLVSALCHPNPQCQCLEPASRLYFIAFLKKSTSTLREILPELREKEPSPPSWPESSRHSPTPALSRPVVHK